MSIDRTVNYESIARDYDRRYQGENDYSGIATALSKFVTGTSIKAALEVGCGTGQWLMQLSQHDFYLAGLDPAGNMLNAARLKSTKADLVQARAEALPWSNRSFDCLFCVNSFHHFSGKEEFLREAYRILRPGGAVMISGLDPHTGLDRWWIYDYFPRVLDLDRKRYPPAQQIRKIMLESGFKECRTEEILHMPVQNAGRYALEKGLLDKNTTSQLIILTEEEYRRGMNRLLRDIETAESKHSTFTIRADLRIYATVGWVAE